MSPTRLEPMEAQGRARDDPDTQDEVDLMILDYLATLAIDRSFCAIEHPDSLEDEDQAEWHAQPIAALQSLVAQRNVVVPDELAVKLRILTLANHLRGYLSARADQIGLPNLGLEFMDLCSFAAPRVSETRWFDLGARIFARAALEERAQGIPPSHALNQLHSWSSNNQSHQSKWEKARPVYLVKQPLNPAMDTQYPPELDLVTLKKIILGFLEDLLNTLDQPILVQLERGKLWDLSTAETQRLKERVGLS